jgi:hypothetical protein
MQGNGKMLMGVRCILGIRDMLGSWMLRRINTRIPTFARFFFSFFRSIV